MPKKRKASTEEIAVLAKRFRGLWCKGTIMRPWMREHRQMVLALVHGDYSWDAIARAFSKANIKYDDGKGQDWTSEGLRREFVRAVRPLKRDKIQPNVTSPAACSPQREIRASPTSTIPSHTAPYIAASAGAVFSDFDDLPATAEPEFRPVRFIDWDERRRLEHEAAANAPSQPPREVAPSEKYSEHYLGVMESLTGKKPPF
jgi:hypothetical protein